MSVRIKYWLSGGSKGERQKGQRLWIERMMAKHTKTQTCPGSLRKPDVIAPHYTVIWRWGGAGRLGYTF